jgi:hypothetical protein
LVGRGKQTELLSHVVVTVTNVIIRNVFTTLSHYPCVELGIQGIQIYKEEIQKTKNITNFAAQWITYSLPAPAIAQMKVRGGNALGIDVDGHLVRKCPYT